MRVATSETQHQAVISLQRQQFNLNKLQQQLSTGERFSAPADDPIAAVSTLNYTEGLETTKQYQSNANVAGTRLDQTDNIISEISNQLQRVRELTIQASSDTTNSSDRVIIAQEVKLLGESLVGLANSKDANGEYLFAGYQGRTTPFTKDGSGNYVYNGDEGQRYLQVGPTRQVAISDSGKEVFTAVRSITASVSPINVGSGTIVAGSVTQPNDYQPHNFTVTFTSATTFDVKNNTTGQTVLANQTYSDGHAIAFNGAEVTISGAPATNDTFIVSPASNNNVFNTIASLVTTLETAPPEISNLTAFHSNMADALNNIDQSMEAITTARTAIGARFNTITSQQDVNSSFSLQMQKSISELKDLDVISATSKFSLQLTSLQAAQQAYVRIQDLSLFKFL